MSGTLPVPNFQLGAKGFQHTEFELEEKVFENVTKVETIGDKSVVRTGEATESKNLAAA